MDRLYRGLATFSVAEGLLD